MYSQKKSNSVLQIRFKANPCNKFKLQYCNFGSHHFLNAKVKSNRFLYAYTILQHSMVIMKHCIKMLDVKK